MSAAFNTQRVIEVIGRTIAPVVGDTVAATTGLMHCRRLGINDGTISSADLDRLLASVERWLTVFVGNQAASKAVAKVRRALLSEDAP
ncbi:MAG TPA: hypothetical protein VMT19_13215 [Thermoanaerobaculaceae bacterium]|nr:hypothetical protein [Thermoanaerobaculaceae bacterium]